MMMIFSYFPSFHSSQEKIFHLSASLPQDRRQAGVLHLYGKNGDQILPLVTMPCLGKADNWRARKAGNSSRDPLRPFGDTPLGYWRVARVAHNRPKRWPLGVIWLGPPHGAEAISGQAYEAAKQGRTGLAIHSGRGNKRLTPTFGCLRMLDNDFHRLIEFLGSVEFDVKIEEEKTP